MAVRTREREQVTGAAVRAAESARTQLHILMALATKLVTVEEELAGAMTDAAALLPDRADHLLAIADEARKSAARWREWAVDAELRPATSGTAPVVAPPAGGVEHARDVRTGRLVERLDELRTRADELRSGRRGSGPAGVARARSRLGAAMEELRQAQLRYVESLEAAAAAHDRAAASLEHAVKTRLANRDDERHAQEHRAAAAADRDRARSARAMVV